MKFLTKLATITTLALLMSNVHAASSASEHEELRVQICSIATSGIKIAATERQAGKSKPATKRKLDRELQELSKNVKNQTFVNHITDTWYRGLDKVYQDPLLKTNEEKAVYISTLTADAIVSCLSNIS
ncbi:MAG: hypothetical protein Q4G13_07430 [Moraxella sp.]|nr:hypothetical protein [Moraxella sp.]